MDREKHTCCLGIDFNDSYAMVSFYREPMEEPQSVSIIAGSENYRIPTLLARKIKIGTWYYGDEAGRMAKTSEVICIDHLLQRAVNGEVIGVGDDNYDAVELLALFIRKLMELPLKLGNLPGVDRLAITVERLNRENMEVFWKVAAKLELSSEQFLVLDHKESFHYFALSQKEDLWRHDVFLYVCDKDLIYSYDLKRDVRTSPQMISIHESGKRALSENRDKSFGEILSQSMENRIVSAVYLVGDGFDGGWMKDSLNILCRGRRAFMGNNLFSKGACYGALVRGEEEKWPYIYMGENEMKFNLSIKVRDQGDAAFYNLISAGRNWFEAKGECEVILCGTPEIDFWKQLPNSREAVIEPFELTGLPRRPDKTTRLRITARAVSDDKITVEIKDLGFGELFRGTDKVWKYTTVM